MAKPILVFTFSTDDIENDLQLEKKKTELLSIEKLEEIKKEYHVVFATSNRVDHGEFNISVLNGTNGLKSELFQII